MRPLMNLAAMLGGLAGFGPAVATGASFDCGAAAPGFELSVCGSEDLSRLDEVLAVAYETALGGLSEAARAEIVAGQRNWLSVAQVACTPDAVALTRSYSSDEVQCLVNLYNQRIDALSHSRMEGDARLYPVTRYAAYDDPQAPEDGYVRTATKSMRYTLIDDDDAFNAFLDERISQNFFMATLLSGSDPAPDTGSDEMAHADIVAITNSRISVEFFDWVYFHGGAHGNYAISTLHFLRDEGRALKASDIFVGDDWLPLLHDLVVERFKRDWQDGVIVEDFSGIDETIANPERWSFISGDGRPDALGIQFQTYEVTAYAWGAPVIAIPWSLLSEHLTETAYSYFY